MTYTEPQITLPDGVSYQDLNKVKGTPQEEALYPTSQAHKDAQRHFEESLTSAKSPDELRRTGVRIREEFQGRVGDAFMLEQLRQTKNEVEKNLTYKDALSNPEDPKRPDAILKVRTIFYDNEPDPLMVSLLETAIDRVLAGDEDVATGILAVGENRIKAGRINPAYEILSAKLPDIASSKKLSPEQRLKALRLAVYVDNDDINTRASEMLGGSFITDEDLDDKEKEFNAEARIIAINEARKAIRETEHITSAQRIILEASLNRILSGDADLASQIMDTGEYKLNHSRDGEGLEIFVKSIVGIARCDSLPPEVRERAIKIAFTTDDQEVLAGASQILEDSLRFSSDQLGTNQEFMNSIKPLAIERMRKAMYRDDPRDYEISLLNTAMTIAAKGDVEVTTGLMSVAESRLRNQPEYPGVEVLAQRLPEIINGEALPASLRINVLEVALGSSNHQAEAAVYSLLKDYLTPPPSASDQERQFNSAAQEIALKKTRAAFYSDKDESHKLLLVDSALKLVIAGNETVTKEILSTITYCLSINSQNTATNLARELINNVLDGKYDIPLILAIGRDKLNNLVGSF